jgi:hypothetical protein
MSTRFGPRAAVGCLGLFLTAAAPADRVARIPPGDPVPPVVEPDQRSVVVVVESDPSGRIPPKRYWADHAAGAIRRSNVDGSGMEVVVSGLSGPYGLAYDARARLFVWTDSADEAVQAASPDSFAPAPLQSSFEDAYAIVSATEETETAYAVLDGRLMKLTVDRRSGAEQQEVLLELDAFGSVHGLALSPDGGALYLGDAVGQMSRKVRLADRGVETIMFSGGPPAVPDPDGEGAEPRS